MSVDTILHNAKIATNQVPSFVEAVAISSGKISAAGKNEDILRLRAAGTQVIDAQRRTAIPGLNDSHIHPIRGGLNYNLELRWDGVSSLADATADVEGTGCTNARAPMGTGDRRLDRIPIRRTPDAYA